MKLLRNNTYNNFFTIVVILFFTFFLNACSAKDPFKKEISRIAVPARTQTETTQSQLAILSVEELAKRGDTFYRGNNLQLARLHFAIALQKNPDYFPAMAGLGDVLYRQNEINSSKALFTRIIQNEPDNFRAALGLGRIARDRGEYTDAMEFLYMAKDSQPENPEILNELAMAHDLLGQGNLALAEPLYREALTLQPDDPQIINNLGFNLFLQGRYSEAISYLNKALSFERDNPRIINNLATAYLLNGQEIEAFQLFEKSTSKAAAYNNIGYLYMTQGSWDKADLAFRKALQSSPTFYLRAQQNLDRLKSLRTQPPQTP